jgi:DNA-binding PadR family transcriptional regulator
LDEFPGAFEQLVLLALLRLGDAAYGMTVRREIAARTGRDVSLGAVYATLDRLERKGWIASHAGDNGGAGDAVQIPERAGRARRFFRLLPSGDAVLRRSLDALDSMRPAAAARRRTSGTAGTNRRPRTAGADT